MHFSPSSSHAFPPSLATHLGGPARRHAARTDAEGRRRSGELRVAPAAVRALGTATLAGTGAICGLDLLATRAVAVARGRGALAEARASARHAMRVAVFGLVAVLVMAVLGGPLSPPARTPSDPALPLGNGGYRAAARHHPHRRLGGAQHGQGAAVAVAGQRRLYSLATVLLGPRCCPIPPRRFANRLRRRPY